MRITTARAELDVALIHRFLAQESHWARGISVEAVRTGIDNSFCIGGFIGSSQIAFGRVVTDYATFGYVKDVFVLAGHRGQGHGNALIRALLAHPVIDALPVLLLQTSTAPALYRRHGFVPVPSPERLMRRERGAPAKHV